MPINKQLSKLYTRVVCNLFHLSEAPLHFELLLSFYILIFDP